MSRHLDDTGSGHPILGFLDALERGLDDVAEAPAWSLNASETSAAVSRLVADLARLAEVEGRLLDQAKTLDLPGEIGARSLSSWLAKQTRMTGGEAARRVRLAKTLNTHPPTKAAVVSVGEPWLESDQVSTRLARLRRLSRDACSTFAR
jgi:hypothetical protein